MALLFAMFFYFGVMGVAGFLPIALGVALKEWWDRRMRR